MNLSIVSTLYRSAPFLREFCGRASLAAMRATANFEIVLVNDGSPDESLLLALELQRADSRIRIVDLSRNFGHHAAIMAGLEHARGDLVFLLDCDLEEQPEWLDVFTRKLADTDADVVFGVQNKRIASFWTNLFGSLFWFILARTSSVEIPRNPMTCRLMTRRYVDALVGVGDRVLYLASVFAWTGFQQQSIALTKQPRAAGHASSYGFSRKLVQVVDSLTSFSAAPLTAIFFAGLAIWIGSILIGAFVLVKKLVDPSTVLSGFTSVMLSIWFIGGLVILILGTLGLYISKIFQEVKPRPLYIVRKLYGDDRG